MAPIKFENKLKDKLENRSLQPSSDAWSTLADRLDKEDKKNSSTRFWWLGIAATVVGVVFVTTQFYKNTSAVENLPIVVETKTDTPRSDSELIIQPVTNDELVSNSEMEKGNIEDSNTTEIVSVSKNKTTELQKPILKEKAILQIEETKDVVASLEKSKDEINNNSLVEVMTMEELKIMEVVAEIKQLQANESSVSEEEIDSLLKQAQREILKQNIYDETTRTVNADALLQDVEVELEQSFRDKVFEALKSSYSTVKTAVAQRHN